MEIVYREIEYFFFFSSNSFQFANVVFGPLPPLCFLKTDWKWIKRANRSLDTRAISILRHTPVQIYAFQRSPFRIIPLAKPIEFSNPTWIWGATETTREIGFHCCKSVPPPLPDYSNSIPGSFFLIGFDLLSSRCDYSKIFKRRGRNLAARFV